MESLLCSVAQKVAKLKISCEEAILEAEVIETEVASILKEADTCVQLMQESTSENAQQVFLNTSQALQEPENSLTLVAAQLLDVQGINSASDTEESGGRRCSEASACEEKDIGADVKDKGKSLLISKILEKRRTILAQGRRVLKVIKKWRKDFGDVVVRADKEEEVFRGHTEKGKEVALGDTNSFLTNLETQIILLRLKIQKIYQAPPIIRSKLKAENLAADPRESIEVQVEEVSSEISGIRLPSNPALLSLLKSGDEKTRNLVLQRCAARSNKSKLSTSIDKFSFTSSEMDFSREKKRREKEDFFHHKIAGFLEEFGKSGKPWQTGSEEGIYDKMTFDSDPHQQPDMFWMCRDSEGLTKLHKFIQV